MTRDELIAYALALTGERPGEDPDTECFAKPLTELLLKSLLGAENHLRAVKGLPELATVPDTDAGDIPFQREITDGPLIYCTAAALAKMNGETADAEEFRTEGVRLLRKVMPVLCAPTPSPYARGNARG
ncbi:MAG: hypothetical protein Q4C53_08110 [Clostridia bacterium]|nr:hypothetical protein [Clostridia bacterium]